MAQMCRTLSKLQVQILPAAPYWSHHFRSNLTYFKRRTVEEYSFDNCFTFPNMRRFYCFSGSILVSFGGVLTFLI